MRKTIHWLLFLMFFAALAFGQPAKNVPPSVEMHFPAPLDVLHRDLLYYVDVYQRVTIRITEDGELKTSGPITKRQALKKLFRYYSNLVTEAQSEVYRLKHPEPIQLQNNKGPTIAVIMKREWPSVCDERAQQVFYGAGGGADGVYFKHGKMYKLSDVKKWLDLAGMIL